MPDRPVPEPRNPDTAFEPADVNLRALGFLAAGVLLWLGLVPYFLSLGYPDATRDAFKAPTVEPPAPRLQTDPQKELAEFRAEKRQRLTTYGWVDQAHGIAHIPIDEAMKRIAARGLPDWPAKPEAAVSQVPPP